jgi:hypothetical protein
MVRDAIWTEAKMQKGYLCIGCLEQRLGRTLTADDFADLPVNEPHLLETRRITSRKMRPPHPPHSLKDFFEE